MSSFIQLVNEYTKVLNGYLGRTKDLRLDFHLANELISEYYPKLLAAAVDDGCEVHLDSSVRWTSNTVKLQIQYMDEENDEVYYLALIKSTEVRLAGTGGWLEPADPYLDCCTMRLSVVSSETGEVLSNCAIQALPTRDTDYEDKPYTYLDKTLKGIFSGLSEKEKCYLYLYDTSIRDFFEFKPDDERKKVDKTTPHR